MTDPTKQPSTRASHRSLPFGPAPGDDPEWWDEMTAWTDQRLAERGLRRRGPLVPVRMWARSVVCWFATDRGRMWAKVVPAVFAHEIALTELIADVDPGLAPPVVASDRALGRIVTDHVEGPMLTDVEEPLAWTATLARMAELQRVLAADRQALVTAGVTPAPLDRLADQVPALLADDALLGLGRPSGLSAEEMSSLRKRTSEIVAACRTLAASPFPETLDHGDLTPDEVIVGEMGPVILDWSDGSITHPFLAAASFLAGVDRSPTAVPATHDALADAYLGPWLASTSVPPADARRLLDLARTVHPLHVAALYAERVLPRLQAPDRLDDVVPERLRSLL